MSDIALLPVRIGALGDLEISGGDVVTDGGLETAVYLSLFTDAFDPASGLGGYWGDGVDDQPQGSRLWTLARTVITPGLTSDIKGMCVEALQWLVDAGVASTVDAAVSVIGQFAVGISVSITRGGVRNQYSYNWDSQAGVGF